MTNPNPSVIPQAIWQLWLLSEQIIPGVRLGGVYAPKSGYHNTVNANKVSWPGNYSIRLPLDLTQPANMARALDLTMDDAQMRLRTGYLRASALDPQDTRLDCLREFYGTLNNQTVYGLIKDNENGPWLSSTSDSSHLWHIHLSFFTDFCDNWTMVAPVASVLSGQSYSDWIGVVVEMAFLVRDTQNRVVIVTDDWNGWFRPPQASTAQTEQVINDRIYWRKVMGLPTERWVSENGKTQAVFNFDEGRTLGVFGPNLAVAASGVDYDRIEGIVDGQLDEQSRAGADND